MCREKQTSDARKTGTRPATRCPPTGWRTFSVPGRRDRLPWCATYSGDVTMHRRQFIRRAALASTAALSADRVLGANDRVRLGLIGCGGRGMYVARLMAKVPGAEFVAACDAYDRNA